MRTLFAALATASIVAAPLAASAQDHQGGFGGRGGRGGADAPGAPAAQAPANPAPAGRGGRFDRGGQPGGLQPRGDADQRQAQRNFGGGDRFREFAGRGPDRGFDRRGDDRRDFDHRDFGRGEDRRGFYDRDGRRDFAHRGHDRGYDNRGFRWGVGAFLPRAYWNAFVDPFAYGLERAPYGYHWVVVDDEALLIDNYTGAIVQAFFL